MAINEHYERPSEYRQWASRKRAGRAPKLICETCVFSRRPCPLIPTFSSSPCESVPRYMNRELKSRRNKRAQRRNYIGQRISAWLKKWERTLFRVVPISSLFLPVEHHPVDEVRKDFFFQFLFPSRNGDPRKLQRRFQTKPLSFSETIRAYADCKVKEKSLWSCPFENCAQSFFPENIERWLFVFPCTIYESYYSFSNVFFRNFFKLTKCFSIVQDIL